MTLPLNPSAIQKLIDEDLAWLLKQPRTLERDHIEQIVRSFFFFQGEKRALSDLIFLVKEFIKISLIPDYDHPWPNESDQDKLYRVTMLSKMREVVSELEDRL